jgi:hypothetical protein
LIKNSYHIILVVVLLVFLQACQRQGKDPIDVRESYLYNDTRPFGGSVAYEMVQKAYPEKTVEIGKKEFSENYSWHYDTSSVYVNCSNSYFATERDAQALLDFVYKGNTAFISAAYFDDSLMSKLYCKQTFIYQEKNPEDFKQTSTEYTEKISLYKDSFNYFFLPFENYFDSINSSYARVLGYNKEGKTNMFTFLWGKGRFYFQCEPRAFSNYFLLTNNNYKYMQQALQMLPANPENVYWDNYYAKKNYASNGDSSGSTLSEIFKHPPLKAAFWISLLLLLLYILFGMKRRQRIIPIVKPTENTSIAFAEAIAGLYLSKKDNKVIADKIITYFNEQVRTKYFLNININDSSYADVLSRKSAVPLETTKELTNTITSINASLKVSDEQLLALNGLVERFFRKVG